MGAIMGLVVVGGCSTPYGIKGTITPDPVATVFALRQCSTPYGIKGTIALLKHQE